MVTKLRDNKEKESVVDIEPKFILNRIKSMNKTLDKLHQAQEECIKDEELTEIRASEKNDMKKVIWPTNTNLTENITTFLKWKTKINQS